MKKTTIVLGIILISGSILAQTPQSFKYQAVARNSQGTVLANYTVDLRISLLAGSPSGSLIYQEKFTETTNAAGLVNIDIGTGIVISGNFSTITWGN
mgnify:CR=1 FL=1